MTTLLESDTPPVAGEGLAAYVRRLRTEQCNLTQGKLAEMTGVHLQTIRKIESGETKQVRAKVRSGLALALGIAEEYLEAASKGSPMPKGGQIKICPQCWIPGKEPEVMWTNTRAKYCFLCSYALQTQCQGCGEGILSYRFRFCPHCGQAYKK